MNVRVLVGSLVALLCLAGCLGTSQPSNNVNLQASAAIQAAPDHVNLGDTLVLSLTPAALFQRYDGIQWHASASVEGDPWSCQESLNSAALHCVPAAAGPLVVTCDITSSTGLKPIHLEKQIVVSGGEEDNPVRLVLDLSKATDGSLIATRSSAAALNANSASVLQGQAVKFDFTRSDREDLNLLVDDGLTGVLLAESYVSNHTYTQPGDYSVRVEARNQNNLVVGRLNFVLSVTCLNPNLALDASQVNLSADSSIDGRFVLGLGAGFATGGQGTLRMRVDFNGDGVTDLDWTPISTQSAGFYSVDAGSSDVPQFQTRALHIEVADSQCNAHASVAVPYAFPIPHADGDPSHDQQAQRPGVNFLQAIVKGSDPSDPTTNTAFNASGTSATAAYPTGPYIGCNFNGYGSGSIPSYMHYPLGSQDTDGYWTNLHGFTMFNFYVPTYSIDTQDYSGVTYNVKYETAFQPDGTHQRRHYTAASCPGKLSVKTQQTLVGDCQRISSGNTGNQSVKVSFQLVGTFACANLPAAEDSSTISLSKGSFSCLVGNGNSINMNKACTSPPAAYCGDYYTETGEQCDDGPQNGHDHYCNSDCTYTAGTCGDGFTQHGEECDFGSQNGHATTGTYCDSNCHWAWGGGTGGGGGYCGDGIKNGTEQCDAGYAGNGTAASGCNTDCTSILCGNGKVEPGEECDNGAQNGQPHNACDATCHLHPG